MIHYGYLTITVLLAVILIFTTLRLKDRLVEDYERKDINAIVLNVMALIFSTSILFYIIKYIISLFHTI